MGPCRSLIAFSVAVIYTSITLINMQPKMQPKKKKIKKKKQIRDQAPGKKKSPMPLCFFSPFSPLFGLELLLGVPQKNK